MSYMNDYDIQSARSRFTQDSMPNRLALAMVVDNLREWTNNHSDGWAYWPKPCRAAEKAIALIDGYRYEDDITEVEMRAAVRPIKSFLTRQKVDPMDKERILRAVTG